MCSLQELAGLGVEHLVSLEGGGAGGGQQARMPGWGDLPSEAFEQRHEIKEGGREEDLLTGEEGEGAMQTVTVEDKTSAVVVWGVHAQDTRYTQLSTQTADGEFKLILCTLTNPIS